MSLVEHPSVWPCSQQRPHTFTYQVGRQFLFMIIQETMRTHCCTYQPISQQQPSANNNMLPTRFFRGVGTIFRSLSVPRNLTQKQLGLEEETLFVAITMPCEGIPRDDKVCVWGVLRRANVVEGTMQGVKKCTMRFPGAT